LSGDLREPNLEIRNIRAGGHLLLSGCNLYDCCPTFRQPDCRALDIRKYRDLSLRPYPALALFAVPLIVLEPVKPVAAYLGGTGHIAVGMTVLVIGEVLKLVLVERLFSVSRHKLISIPAFAWTYGRYLRAKEWLESFEAWQTAWRLRRLAGYAVRTTFKKWEPARD
jgi:hypothetical protein